MNVLFALIFILAATIFLFINPEGFLPALLDGAQKAATLSLSLLGVYCVWMGLTQVMEDCGLTKKISTLLRPAVKKLFATDSEEAATAISLNLSANMLGVSGAATPFGIQAVEQLAKGKNAHFGQSMLLVINATSVQLFPTTALALLTDFGAQNASYIVLPSLLASGAGTLLGVGMVWLFFRKIRAWPRRDITKCKLPSR